MPSYSATGLTLTVHKYQGTQRIAAFYTRECGKVEATVSGVGKPGSKLAPAVEPLTLSRLYFATGRNLDRLIQCEVVESFYDLRRDLTRLAWASYAAELVAETTEPGQPEPEVFDALVETVRAMTRGRNVELMAWGFVVRYLAHRGLSPALDSCAGCGRSIESAAVYVSHLGSCLCRRCQAEQPNILSAESQATLGPDSALLLSVRVRSALQSLGRLEISRLDRLRLDPGTLSQIRALLRRHLAFHVGVKLRSEEFLAKMTRNVK